MLVYLRYFLCLCFLSTIALATREISTDNIRVLYESAELDAYAQRVANEAERALAILADLFETDPPRVTLRIESGTDVFNAFAPPVPRPSVALRALFPTESDIGFGARDDLYLLLLHELTHSVQLTYDDGPEDSGGGLRLGLVGEGTARVPPSWFLEGIATWVESEYTEGGRNDDARTHGLLLRAAYDDTFPTLTEASLINYAPFPAGLTRYLFGAGFVDYLVDTYGFEMILKVLRRYNVNGFFATFSDAWRREVGTSLEGEWQAWQAHLRAEAEAILNNGRVIPELTTQSAWYTRSPTPSPDGSQLAWAAWPPGIALADVVVEGDEVRLENTRIIHPGSSPNSLTWLDDDTLAYSQLASGRAGDFSDIFVVDTDGSNARQLTEAARARLPKATPAGCLLFIHNVEPSGSSLRQWCPVDNAEDTITTLWQATDGEQLLNLAVSREGQLAASLWRRGFVDLALFDEASSTWTYLNQDKYQDLEPSWLDEDTLLFSSDRAGQFDIYSLNINQAEAIPLSQTLGGAFQPAYGSDVLWYVALGGSGYDLVGALLVESTFAQGVGMVGGITADDTTSDNFIQEDSAALADEGATSTTDSMTSDEAFKDTSTTDTTILLNAANSITLPTQQQLDSEPLPEPFPQVTYPVENYQPWSSLAPYGWLPTGFGFALSPFEVAVSASIFGQDDSAQHSYSVNLGVNTSLEGDLDGAFINARYALGANNILNAFAAQNPVTLGLQVGIWPHVPHLGTFQETALGALGDASTQFPVTVLGTRMLARTSLQAGALRLPSYGDWQFDGRTSVVLSNQRSDLWSYGSRGWLVGVTGVWSATEVGRSLGTWANVRYFRPLALGDVNGTLELNLRAGYRPPEPIAVDFDSDLSAALTVGYRYSIPMRWRYGDGLYSLERLSFEPRGRLWLDDTVGVGADLTVNADTLINYGAPVSFGGSVGYAESFWFRVGLRLPL